MFIINLDKNQKILLIVVCIFILSVIGYYIYTTIQNLNNETIETMETESETNSISSNSIIEENKTEDTIIIHIAGHVKNAGIVKLQVGSRIVDAIEAARWTFRYCRFKKRKSCLHIRRWTKSIYP